MGRARALRPPLAALPTRVIVDPGWHTAVTVVQDAALGYVASRPFIDDERFRTLTGAWVAVMGDPSASGDVVRLGIGSHRQEQVGVADRVELVKHALREVEMGHEVVTRGTVIPGGGLPGSAQKLAVRNDGVPVT